MTKRSLLLATTILSLVPFLASPSMAAETDDVAALRAENAKLQKALSAMMSRLDKIEARTAESATKADAAAATAEKAVTVADDGSFKLPGTGTTVKISGFAKLDAIHDFSGRPGTSTGSTDADSSTYTSIPLDTDTTSLNQRDHATRLHARSTRVGLATNTPTSTFGPVKTLIEIDFLGTAGTSASNSHAPRLRRAFGTIGNFLAGQEWSTYVDTTVLPELLDAYGPVGATTMRQAQIRYTHDFGGGHKVVGALENPETDFTTSAAATNTNAINHYPDLIAGYRYEAGWGHIGARAMLRNLAYESKGAAPLNEDSAWGYGFVTSGRWLPFADSKGAAYSKDALFGQIMAGNGLGRYMNEATNLGAAVNNTTQVLELQKSWGGFIGYKHYWLDNLRSSAVYGFARNDIKQYLATTNNKEVDAVSANLIWSPVPSTDIGVEYIWGSREVESGVSGDMSRIQGSVKYSF